MSLKHIHVQMPDMTDRPANGWAERIIKRIIWGSQAEWIRKYRIQHYQNRIDLARDDEVWRHKSSTNDSNEPF